MVALIKTCRGREFQILLPNQRLSSSVGRANGFEAPRNSSIPSRAIYIFLEEVAEAKHCGAVKSPHLQFGG